MVYMLYDALTGRSRTTNGTASMTSMSTRCDGVSCHHYWSN